MAERVINRPEDESVELSVAQRAELAIEQRIETIQGRPAREYRILWPAASDPNGEVTPFYLFQPPLRRSMLISASLELARSRVRLGASTVGVTIEDPGINRGLQLLVAAMHNHAIRTQNLDQRLIKDNPSLDLILPSSLLLQGIQSIERQLAALPDDKRELITLLDLADMVIVYQAQGRSPRPKPKSGRRKREA